MGSAQLTHGPLSAFLCMGLPDLLVSLLLNLDPLAPFDLQQGDFLKCKLITGCLSLKPSSVLAQPPHDISLT